MDPQLELKNVTKRFGGVAAVDDVTFAIGKGEILGVIGPNGAGKTTLLNCISGVYRLDGGDVRWQGESIAGLAPFRVARLGIGRTFQIVKPFTSMTVRENVVAGALFGSDEDRPRLGAAFGRADGVLELVGLRSKADLPVSAMTIPDRKRLEVARAVATRPKLLLLDEVMAGLNPVEIDDALEMVRAVHQSGVTVVLIEHVMRVIVGVCARVVVLDVGRMLADGPPDVVLRDERVIQAYLGERYARRLRGS
ncbi:MAG: ABC transporter ATP-binding protein [Chloroflexi bacterium]|nr:MAG: ABC transporter ATP-binding protein [Chloroflexota bacterium]TMF06879.1 MAG: ABC transporter ATP-binding protein [Chloroflexota bacterium]TMG26143.1 MAG: ABC transporter ATP-binding protein [Chloroflexota bacterium]